TAFVMLIAAIKLCSFLFGFDTGIDTWLFKRKVAADTVYGKHNEMASNTAFSFLCLGTSLMLFKYEKGKVRLLADYLALLAAFISFVSLIGYLYSIIEFYKLSSDTPMSFPGAVAFFLISMAILLARSEFGLFSLFTRKYEGSRMSRLLIPFVILVPVVLGMIRLYGQQEGWFSSELGTALFATANVIVFVAIIARLAISINRSGKAVAEEYELRKKIEQQIILRDNQIAVTEASLMGQEKTRRQIAMELH